MFHDLRELLIITCKSKAKIYFLLSLCKLFFKLRSAKKSLFWLTKEETINIANDLGVKASEVTQMEAEEPAKNIIWLQRVSNYLTEIHIF